MDPGTLAKEMYNVYGDSAGWKNYASLPMPTWETLTDAIRTHWTASAQHAIARMACAECAKRAEELDRDIDDGT